MMIKGKIPEKLTIATMLVEEAKSTMFCICNAAQQGFGSV